MKYPPESVGRVIECLEVYCPWNDFAHTCQIGNGEVTLHGDLVARFTWPDDNPLFDFVDPTYQERQFFIRPFLDSPFRHEIVAIVHDIRQRISFWEAMAIRHVRDRLGGDWGGVDAVLGVLEKIDRRLMTATRRDLPRSAEDTKHIALCVIYDIPTRRPFPPGLYAYKPPGGEEVLAEVTEKEVYFGRWRRRIPLANITRTASLRPLKYEDIPEVAEHYFVILIDGAPGVVAPILGPTPRPPVETLRLYAEQYGFDLKQLSWAIVPRIPMPVPEENVSPDLTT